MIEVVIDGRRVEVEKDTTVLQAAKQVGVRIPTMCHHDALPTYGACRICSVEVKTGKRSKIVTACNFPIQQPMAIETANDKILSYRRMLLQLMLAKHPDVDIVQRLARAYGATPLPFKQEKSDCILCGMCVRVCEDVMKVSALGFSGRGVHEDAETPYALPSDVCIGCGACDFVCPTGCIQMADGPEGRSLARWKTEREWVNCLTCGEPVATRAQIEYLKQRVHVEEVIYQTCPDCRQKEYVVKVAMERHM